jgi:hypothetical protein
MFNISEIIQNQMPDMDGNLIPSSVHEGSAKISGTQAENEHILVAMDEGIYNVRKATCHYGCNNCNGMTSSLFYVPDFTVPYQGNSQLSVQVTWNTGSKYDRTKLATWTSSNQSIATVSQGLTYGVTVWGHLRRCDD